MKSQRAANIFSVLNLLLLFFLLIQTPSTAQQSVEPLVRARAIELVDEGGKVRAQLNVESTGEVVFRLRDAKGTIRSKFGADESGSGLSLMDDRTEATVQIRANQSGGSMILIDRDGNKRAIK
ncbi:MAG TPA: hypothetical protein VF791_16075 [Pyrinomonadaceae bacterium]